MMKTDGNDAAFAVGVAPGLEHDGIYEHGLTKREYYAGLAMQGMCASGANWHGDSKIVGKAAVEYADALMAALGGGNNEERN